jgi:intracellular sulfur oxidation DsrE/DsrF family protein
MEYDVDFYGCRNTMESMKWTEDDFIDDIIYVQAGIVEAIEKQVDGFIGITPY